MLVRPRSLSLIPGLLALAACTASRPGPQVIPSDVSETPPDVRRYAALRADQPMTIDGRLDEAAWAGAPWSDPFVDIQGAWRPAPEYRTRAKMLWDSTALYIGAELVEPHLWATLTEHDAVIFRDNDFEVFLDPDGDTHRYYELEINALGTTWDLFLDTPYRDGGPARNEFEIAGLESAVSLDGTLNDPSDIDRGWTVELKIPFAALPDRPGGASARPPAEGEQWRVNFSRVQWRLDRDSTGYLKRLDPHTLKPLPEDNWVWSPQDAINMHMPEMWGVVEFSALPPGSSVTPRPLGDAGTRWTLRRVYYAQRRYLAEHGHYAGRLDELGIVMPAVIMARTRGGYEARMAGWMVDQTGRLGR